MINGTCFLNAIISGSNNILKHKNIVDKLNIFPVPDGDTGTNISMTIKNAKIELEKIKGETNISLVAKTVSSALLRGARGNSGVILSLIFKGFEKAFLNKKTVNGKDLVEALNIGVKEAYTAVMKPTEGTMLTVARVAYETAHKALFKSCDPVFIWNEVCCGAEKALAETPELLPILKRAGVVDAGGKGLCLIFEGMRSVFRDGIILEDNNEKEASVLPDTGLFLDAEIPLEETTFTYCTEYIISKKEDAIAGAKELREFLESIGDCVVVVEDDEIIKVHVHTEQPDLALQKALMIGELLTIKIENMRQQNINILKTAKKALEKQEPVEEYGFVSIANGDGIKNLFKDLGCNNIVCGGQTMNPSTEDILEAILATPAKTVFVLPNNKNIILAAEQTRDLVEDRQVVIIPTRTIPQGLSAMLSFEFDNNLEENIFKMEQAFQAVKTGQITTASKDYSMGGLKVKEGEILALEEGRPVLKTKNPVKALIKLAHHIIQEEDSFITIIYGEEIKQEDAEYALEIIQSKYGKNADVTLVAGNQPVYHFILSVE